MLRSRFELGQEFRQVGQDRLHARGSGVNAWLRKIIKTRGHLPSDDAATKWIWLVLRNITADWGRAAKDWKEAMNQFAILI